MKALSRPLLEVHLKEPDTLAVSPLRNFAEDILVCPFICKKTYWEDKCMSLTQST